MHIVGNILLGADKEVAEWVASRVPHVGERGFGPAQALGVMRNGRAVAGVVYHNLGGHIVEVSFAAEPKSNWATRPILRTLFAYPFVQLNCVVMVARTGRKNKKARKLLKALGFRETGLIPKGIDGKQDAILYAMERDDCIWLKGKTT